VVITKCLTTGGLMPSSSGAVPDLPVPDLPPPGPPQTIARLCSDPSQVLRLGPTPPPRTPERQRQIPKQRRAASAFTHRPAPTSRRESGSAIQSDRTPLKYSYPDCRFQAPFRGLPPDGVGLRPVVYGRYRDPRSSPGSPFQRAYASRSRRAPTARRLSAWRDVRAGFRRSEPPRAWPWRQS